MLDERVKILHRMQGALRNEFLAASVYERHAHYAREQGRTDLAERLLLMADTHREHMESWSIRIRELGGRPEVGSLPKSVVAPGEGGDLMTALERDLKLEDTEIEDYQVLASQSDEETTHLCERCMEDDRRNLRWLREQLDRGQYEDLRED